jgi:hypothetical protein
VAKHAAFPFFLQNSHYRTPRAASSKANADHKNQSQDRTLLLARIAQSQSQHQSQADDADQAAHAATALCLGLGFFTAVIAIGNLLFPIRSAAHVVKQTGVFLAGTLVGTSSSASFFTCSTRGFFALWQGA